MKRYILPVVLLLLIGYFVFNFFYNKHQIAKLHYGVKANPLRQKLFIPIIDDYMKAIDPYNRYLGNHWKSKKELPSNNEVLHVWKVVTPLTDTAGLYQESDAFRKRFNDSLVYQLNINAKVSGDTLAAREGELFFYHGSPLSPGQKFLSTRLNDDKIDSIANSWGLSYLVRKQ